MRTYGQYCPVARTLDVVGDRWTLLIIRELIARDGRYSDLRGALPGIATNLLADRLRQLQTDGLVEAYDAPPPVGATVYRLSDRGRGLRPVIRELASWGLPLLDAGQRDDEFRTQWLILTLRAAYGKDRGRPVMREASTTIGALRASASQGWPAFSPSSQTPSRTPSPGVTLRGAGLRIVGRDTHDVIVRGLRTGRWGMFGLGVALVARKLSIKTFDAYVLIGFASAAVLGQLFHAPAIVLAMVSAIAGWLGAAYHERHS